MLNMTFHTQGVKLRQAAQQQLFNKALEDAESKLDEMEKAVSSDDLGKDLRSVKDLLHKHQVKCYSTVCSSSWHQSSRVVKRNLSFSKVHKGFSSKF